MPTNSIIFLEHTPTKYTQFHLYTITQTSVVGVWCLQWQHRVDEEQQTQLTTINDVCGQLYT